MFADKHVVAAQIRLPRERTLRPSRHVNFRIHGNAFGAVKASCAKLIYKKFISIRIVFFDEGVVASRTRIARKRSRSSARDIKVAIRRDPIRKVISRSAELIAPHRY